jgi:hypothetical protein
MNAPTNQHKERNNMAPGGYYTGTTTSNTNTTGTATTGWYDDSSCSRWYNTVVDICNEVLKPLHIHPWRQEPKKIKFKKWQAAKVSPNIFDRKPFLNAYKSARSMAT